MTLGAPVAESGRTLLLRSISGSNTPVLLTYDDSQIQPVIEKLALTDPAEFQTSGRAWQLVVRISEITWIRDKVDRSSCLRVYLGARSESNLFASTAEQRTFRKVSANLHWL